MNNQYSWSLFSHLKTKHCVLEYSLSGWFSCNGLLHHTAADKQVYAHAHRYWLRGIYTSIHVFYIFIQQHSTERWNAIVAAKTQESMFPSSGFYFEGQLHSTRLARHVLYMPICVGTLNQLIMKTFSRARCHFPRFYWAECIRDG